MYGMKVTGMVLRQKRTTIHSTSTESFEDAIQQGVSRVHETLPHIRSAWIKEEPLEVSE